MHKVSVTLTDAHMDRLDEREQAAGVDSRSGALREILDEYDECQTECDRLHTECERLRTKCERLESEKRLLLENKRETAALAEYVERERTRHERKAGAPVWRRMKWWVTGVPED